MPRYIVSGPNKRKYDIVESNFKEFVKKCRKEFGFKKDDDIFITLDDETEVDEEYFQFLGDDTVLIISTSKTPEVSDDINQLASFFHALLARQPQLHDKVMTYLKEPVSPSSAMVILEKMIQATTYACKPPSSRDDDSRWFEGLDTKCKTKEAVLRNSAETRMRSYFDLTKRELLSNEKASDSPQGKAVQYFKERLSQSRYHASYFDRSADQDQRLCDPQGVFECEGVFNQTHCSATHVINPYSSKQERIIFSTWNFDHVIEKSRTVLPELKAALEGKDSSCVNLEYFHDLLFHSAVKAKYGNLKLVHISCHDKKPHPCKCEAGKIFKSNNDPQTNGCIANTTSPRASHNSNYTRNKRVKV